jgi:hypothetical protein
VRERKRICVGDGGERKREHERESKKVCGRMRVRDRERKHVSEMGREKERESMIEEERECVEE